MRHMVAIALLLALAACFYVRIVSAQPFSYDEADYMYAASRGYGALYLEKPSLSIFSLISLKRSPSGRGRISEYVRNSDDIMLYRHFHAPLYFYWLRLFGSVFGTNEKNIRWASIIPMGITAAIAFAGLVRLGSGIATALFAATFILFSPTSMEVARWISPHALYASVSTAALILLAMLIRSRRRLFLYAASLATGVAFLTVEYAPLLLVTAIAVVVRCEVPLHKSGFREILSVLRNVLIAVLAPIVLLWPTGILKLGIMKSYGFFLYFASEHGAEYGRSGFLQVWWNRFASSPVEYVLASAGLISVLFVYRQRPHLEVFPFLLYGTLVVLTTLRNHSESSYYVSSLIPCLAVVAAVGLAQMVAKAHFRSTTVWAALVIALVLGDLRYYIATINEKPDSRLVAAVSLLRQSGVYAERLLIPQVLKPTVHYYFQNTTLAGYTTDLSNYTEETDADSIVARAVQLECQGVLYEGSDSKRLLQRLEDVGTAQSFITSEPENPERAIALFWLDRTASAGLHQGVSQ